MIDKLIEILSTPFALKRIVNCLHTKSHLISINLFGTATVSVNYMCERVVCWRNCGNLLRSAL